MSCQSVSTVSDQLAAVDLALALALPEQGQVESLLSKYSAVFASNDGDLGCTDLIAHEILIVDDVPVRQRYRHIPPSEYEVVKEHVNKLSR